MPPRNGMAGQIGDVLPPLYIRQQIGNMSPEERLARLRQLGLDIPEGTGTSQASWGPPARGATPAGAAAPTQLPPPAQANPWDRQAQPQQANLPPNPMLQVLQQFGGQLPSQQQYVNQTVNPWASYTMHMGPMGSEWTFQGPAYQQAVNAAIANHNNLAQNLVAGYNAATQRGLGVGDIGARMLTANADRATRERLAQSQNQTTLDAARMQADAQLQASQAQYSPQAMRNAAAMGMMQGALQSGQTPDEARRALLEGLRLPMGYFGGSPGQAAPPAASAAGMPTPVPGEAAAPLYSGIRSLLDRTANVQRDRNGVAASEQAAITHPSVGQLLYRLDQSRPGFVRQNLPAIRQYVVDTFGPRAWQYAAAGTDRFGQPPFGAYGTDYLPVFGSVRRGLDTIGSLLGGPSEEMRGRVALQRLLESQGERPQQGFWW